MKTFNVPQFYNGFCCYFKFIRSSFDEVIKFFTLFCLHPIIAHFKFQKRLCDGHKFKLSFVVWKKGRKGFVLKIPTTTHVIH
jgi:hypothetical protein